MSHNESKYVQTELDGAEYETLREIAEERDSTIKEAFRGAIVSWIERQRQVDPTDRAFTVLEELDDDSLPSTATGDARHEDDLVDEWTGDDSESTLADQPYERR